MQTNQRVEVNIDLTDITAEDIAPFQDSPYRDGVVQPTSLRLRYHSADGSNVSCSVSGWGHKLRADGTPAVRRVELRLYNRTLPPAIEELVEKYQLHAEFIITTAAPSSWAEGRS